MAQAEQLVAHLEPEMRLLADRYHCGFPLWSQAVESGAEPLWRTMSDIGFPAVERFPDGSWRSVLGGSERTVGPVVASAC